MSSYRMTAALVAGAASLAFAGPAAAQVPEACQEVVFSDVG